MTHRLDRTGLLLALKARLELDADLGVAFIPVSAVRLEKALAESLDDIASLAKRRAVMPRRPVSPPPLDRLKPALKPAAPSPPYRPATLPAARVRLVPLAEPPANPEKEEVLAPLRREASECRGCGLCETRKSVVWGEGDLDARLMFIGEAPGRDEDLEGRPFVGRSGRLLTDIIEKGMKIPRSRVYIANVLKCRPPGDRNPLPDEVAACARYLEKQIETVAPALIIALGMVAGRALLGLPAGTSGLRKRWREYRGVPLRVLYHPSYLLRQRRSAAGPDGRTEADRETWADVLEIMGKLREMTPGENA
ncbi:MAG: uracil-DNA glycosylase [Planctomycetota bacterium]|jgi:DNA polymerase|nr:uracil-DNA glycosylase [Planctomycetota bacterium]